MVAYQCLECQKSVPGETVKKRVRCPFCGTKVLYKPRVTNVVVEAE